MPLLIPKKEDYSDISHATWRNHLNRVVAAEKAADAVIRDTFTFEKIFSKEQQELLIKARQLFHAAAVPISVLPVKDDGRIDFENIRERTSVIKASFKSQVRTALNSPMRTTTAAKTPSADAWFKKFNIPNVYNLEGPLKRAIAKGMEQGNTETKYPEVYWENRSRMAAWEMKQWKGNTLESLERPYLDVQECIDRYCEGVRFYLECMGHIEQGKNKK